MLIFLLCRSDKPLIYQCVSSNFAPFSNQAHLEGKLNLSPLFLFAIPSAPQHGGGGGGNELTCPLFAYFKIL